MAGAHHMVCFTIKHKACAPKEAHGLSLQGNQNHANISLNLKAIGWDLQAAVKGKGLKDDITVLVLDLVPDDDHKMPPRLTKDGSGQVQACNAPSSPVNVYHPLEDGQVGENAWRQMHW